MSIKELIDSYLDDIVAEHLCRIKLENEEMKRAGECLYILGDEIEKFMKDRDDLQELGKLLRNYDDTRNSEEIINYHEIYVAGIKDGVRLLKELGIVKEY